MGVAMCMFVCKNTLKVLARLRTMLVLKQDVQSKRETNTRDKTAYWTQREELNGSNQKCFDQPFLLAIII